MPIPSYTSNMSLIRPEDAVPLIGAGLPSGFRSSLLDAAGVSNTNGFMSAIKNPMSPEGIANINANAEAAKAATPDSPGMSVMDMYRMASGALQGMGRNMQMQMPSGNTAQIIRDNNQFRFAETPEQKLAKLLRGM